MNIIYPNSNIHLNEELIKALSRLGTNIQFHESHANDITPAASQDNGNVTIDGKPYFLGYLSKEGSVLMRRNSRKPLNVPLLVITENGSLMITTQCPKRIAVKKNGVPLAVWEITQFNEIISPTADTVTVGYNDANGEAHNFVKSNIIRSSDVKRCCIVDGKVTTREEALTITGVKYYKLMQFLNFSRDNKLIVTINGHTVANHSGITWELNTENNNVPKMPKSKLSKISNNEQKSVLMYIKRNPGKTTPSKKWSTEQVEYFKMKLHERQTTKATKNVTKTTRSIYNISIIDPVENSNILSTSDNTESVCINTTNQNKTTENEDTVYLDFIYNKV